MDNSELHPLPAYLARVELNFPEVEVKFLANCKPKDLWYLLQLQFVGADGVKNHPLIQRYCYSQDLTDGEPRSNGVNVVNMALV